MSWSAPREHSTLIPPAETAAEAMPSAAVAVFGANLPAAARYAALLVGDGAIQGVIGPREAPRIWSRHILQCAALAPLLAPGADVADLGSGAGLPGIPLALARPDLRVTLVEPLSRRTRFLEQVVGDLGLTNVEISQRRAAVHATQFPRRHHAVVARAVTGLVSLHRWSRPMLRRGGVLLAMKGERAAEELAASAADLRAAGALAELRELVQDGLADPAIVVLVREDT